MSTNRNPDVTPDSLMQLAFAYWGSRTLLSAVELGLFTELARAPQSEEQLRTRLSLHERSSRDFLDALVALKLLERRDGVYSNTPQTDRFLDRAKPTYIGGIMEMMSRRLFRSWSNLTEGLRTGEPQNAEKGAGDLFAELYRDPARLEDFLGAMTGLSTGIGHALAQKIPWQRYKTFADIGAAQGAIPAILAQHHPHLRGVGADLPVTRPIMEKYLAKMGVADRVKFAPVDFFNEELPSADVLIMGHILHDWDLPTKRMLIQKAFNALPSGGAFIIFESLIDDDRRENAFGLLMSLNMLIETRGGFDYSSQDARGWLRDAGFKDVRTEHLVGPDSMIVAIK